MTDGDPAGHDDLPAGGFSAWLAGMQRALRGEAPADVPCAGCTACCRSSQFVLIGPDETETLAHIPDQLLFPAPRMPEGHVLLGYDQAGCCPMLTDDGCSIYEHRPRTCRTYDCRVLTAAGLEVTEGDKALIAQRARRWRFDFPTGLDRAESAAVRAAARYVETADGVLPDGATLTTSTQHAVIAIEAHGAFLRHDGLDGGVTVVDPDIDAVRSVLAQHTPRRLS